MPRKAKSTGSKARRITAAPRAEESAPLPDHIIERPDGFYWESKSGEGRGPFTTRAEAEADMLSGGAVAAEDGGAEDGLQEAESELGINEWIDPDTGGPAEDNVPRIEDH
ncbi:MAG TPA: hypothetical protein VIV54_06790 [Burkholderiales bacterium]